MRICVALVISFVVSTTAARSQDILAGGAVPGKIFQCTFFNAGRKDVTLTNAQIRLEDGSKPILSANTCDDSAKLAPGANCIIVAQPSGTQRAGCRAVISPSKAHVRGALLSSDDGGGNTVLIDLR